MIKEQFKKVIAFVLILALLLILNIIMDYKSAEFKNINTNIKVVNNNNMEVAGDVLTVPLTIVNLQMFEEENIYTYKIKIESEEKEYKYLENGTKRQTLVLDENKETTVTIKENEYIEILNIPISTKVIIKQEKINENYIDKSEQELITTLQNEVMFYNSKQEVKNPETGDSIIVLIIISIMIIITNKYVKSLKVKKYENVGK